MHRYRYKDLFFFWWGGGVGRGVEKEKRNCNRQLSLGQVMMKLLAINQSSVKVNAESVCLIFLPYWSCIQCFKWDVEWETDLFQWKVAVVLHVWVEHICVCVCVWLFKKNHVYFTWLSYKLTISNVLSDLHSSFLVFNIEIYWDLILKWNHKAASITSGVHGLHRCWCILWN